MDAVETTLTVFFEGQFYVGIAERVSGGELCACRIVFGPEPKDAEVLQYVAERWRTLSFSPPVEAEAHSGKRANPKRMQREIARQVDAAGLGAGTRSQQALSMQREMNKLERRTVSREERALEKQARFDQKQEKRKEKHRGR